LNPPDPADTIRRLNLIRIIAIADFVLLVPLVIAAIADNGLTHVLGPIHGVGFLILVFLCVQGSGEKRWGWWFPIITVVTLGPPGSLYGEWRIRRETVGRLQTEGA
jgi:hypothetical protein